MPTPKATPLRVGADSPDTRRRQARMARIHAIERLTPRQITLRVIYLEDQLAAAEKRLSDIGWRDNPGQGSH